MRNIIIIICFLFSNLCLSQTDSLSNRYDKINWAKYNLNSPKKPLWQKAIIPSALTFTSIALNKPETKLNIQQKIREPFNGYTTHLDDYIQYAPIGIMYGADLFKFKAEHSVWNQTKFLFMSEVITGGIVLGLKHTLKIQRPDSSSFTSYPSGHTAQAFVASQVLYNEFKNTNKLIAYSGYLFSAPTGALRIVNNRHWLPDVLLGAGIGIIVTNIIYHYEPLKNWTPKFLKKNKDLTIQIIPNINDQFAGAKIKLNL